MKVLKKHGRISSTFKHFNDLYEPCLPDDTFASVGGEDDDGSDGGLECSVQVGEALDIQHVHLVQEQDARHQLSNALVDVLIHHFVNLFS